MSYFYCVSYFHRAIAVCATLSATLSTALSTTLSTALSTALSTTLSTALSTTLSTALSTTLEVFAVYGCDVSSVFVEGEVLGNLYISFPFGVVDCHEQFPEFHGIKRFIKGFNIMCCVMCCIMCCVMCCVMC